MRLDKYLANALAITRNESRNLIANKKISVNKKTIIKKDFCINEDFDQVYYNDQLIEYKEFIYIMLNKPQGVVCAVKDNVDKTVIDIIDIKRNIFPIGRLDKDTEGLLLLTNDGKFAHHLTSPKHHIYKKYYVKTKDIITKDDQNKFLVGVEIIDVNKNIYKTKPAVLEIIDANSAFVSISEGKYHQIKKMFLSINNKVEYLKRVAIGQVVLDETLQPGEYRNLTEEEKNILKSNK